MVDQTTEAVKVIMQRMKTAQSRQKSYADKRRLLLEFDVSSKVFLKISPIKGCYSFPKERKVKSSIYWTLRDLEKS